MSYNTIELTRETSETIVVTMSNGVFVNVTLRLGILPFVIALPEEFQGSTSGLLGNFDKDRTNDFIDRSGNMIPNNSTDQQIFRSGQSCKRTLKVIACYLHILLNKLFDQTVFR